MTFLVHSTSFSPDPLFISPLRCAWLPHDPVSARWVERVAMHEATGLAGAGSSPENPWNVDGFRCADLFCGMLILSALAVTGTASDTLLCYSDRARHFQTSVTSIRWQRQLTESSQSLQPVRCMAVHTTIRAVLAYTWLSSPSNTHTHARARARAYD